MSFEQETRNRNENLSFEDNEDGFTRRRVRLANVDSSRPLPVILYDSSGNPVKIRQVEENRLGSECSGISSATGRVLTLQNISTSGGPISAWVESTLISQADITASHLTTSSTITFGVEIYDADNIRVLYYD